MAEAQEAVTCGSCSSLVQHFCLSCSSRLCDNCKSLHDKSHRIVLFIEKYSEDLELCTLHRLVFQVFCKTCDELSCIKCVITKHKGHDLIEIKEKYEEEKKKFKQETEDIKVSALRGTRLSVEQNKKNISDLSQRFSEMRKWAAEDANLAKEIIEQSLQDNLSEINQLESDSGSFLAAQQNALQKHLDVMENEVRIREAKVEEGNPITFLLDIKTQEKEKTNFSKIPEGVIFPLPTFERKVTDMSPRRALTEACGRISHAGSKTKENDLLQFVPAPPAKYWRDDILMVKTLKMKEIVKGDALRHVKHTKNGNIWLTDKGNAYQVKDDGSLVRTITVSTDEHFKIRALGYDKNGHLIICFFQNVSSSVSSMLKNVETNISWPLGTNEDPCCLCLVDNKIVALVSTGILETLKLRFFNDDGTAEKVQITMDKTLHSVILVKASLFKGGIFPVCMSFNPYNGHLVISNADKGIVAGSSVEGKYEFKYEGKHPGLAREFKPWSLECDHYGHALIVDHFNQCIHMLNPKGQFLTLIVSKDHGLHNPYGLSIDRNGQLWVTNYSQKTIKIIKYLE